MRQPYYDFEIAKISAWCRAHGYTCHVSLSGNVDLRKKCLPEPISPNISLTTTAPVIETGPREMTAIGALMPLEIGMDAYGLAGVDVAAPTGILTGPHLTRILCGN